MYVCMVYMHLQVTFFPCYSRDHLPTRVDLLFATPRNVVHLSSPSLSLNQVQAGIVVIVIIKRGSMADAPHAVRWS